MMPIIPDYSWNVFRYLGDTLHAVSVLVVLFSLLKNQHSRGLSFKTQFFYLLIFLTRYLDLWSATHSAHSSYLILFKIFYIISSATIVILMRRWAATIETSKDTCSYLFVLVPCALAALVSLLGSKTSQHTPTLFCWIFSEFLEAFAMLPQYIFTYRQDSEQKRSDKGVFLFICLVGVYRVLYAFNWIFKRAMLGSAYTDTVSWIGGLIEIALFFDFIVNRNFLRLIVLSLDTRVNEFTQQIELTVFTNNSQSEHIVAGLRNRKFGNGIETDETMLMI